MTIWLMEPRDPLIVRDGRPFGTNPGARAISLSFPFPSTIAGGIRTRAGLDDKGSFKYTKDNKEALEHLKALQMRGPLLVQLSDDGSGNRPLNWFAPAPHDVLLLEPSDPSIPEKRAFIKRLVPLQLPQGAQTDFDSSGVTLVGQQGENDPRKPLTNSPTFWNWQLFEQWLLAPTELTGTELKLSAIGPRGLEREQRLHVSIEADREAARDGMLFETSGLEFTLPGDSKHRLMSAQRLALAMAVKDDAYSIQPGMTGFGGERRLVTWRKCVDNVDFPQPICPDKLVQEIIQHKVCRLLLLTPACFEQGYLPSWLQQEAEAKGVIVTLKAIAIHRPQVVSGWDLAAGAPKPSRRLAPAGTVFFLSLAGKDEALRAWIESVWMQCISDDVQDRADGFGLAILGTSPEHPVAMQ